MFISNINNLISTVLANKKIISFLLQCLRFQNSTGNIMTLFILRDFHKFFIRKTEVAQEIFDL